MTNPMNEEWFAQLEKELNEDVTAKEEIKSPAQAANTTLVLSLALLNTPTADGHTHAFMFEDTTGAQEIFTVSCDTFDQVLNDLGLLVSKLAFTREFDKLNPQPEEDEDESF